MDAIEGFDIGGGGQLDAETAALLLQILAGGGGMGGATALPQPATSRALPSGTALQAIAGAPPAAAKPVSLKPDIWGALLSAGPAIMEASQRPGATTLGSVGAGLKYGMAADEGRQVKEQQLQAALNNAEMRKWQAMLTAANRQDTLAQQGAYRANRLDQIDRSQQAQQDYRTQRLGQIDSGQADTRAHRAAMRAIAQARLNLAQDRTGGRSVSPAQRANLINSTISNMRRDQSLMYETDENLRSRAEKIVDRMLGTTPSMPAPDTEPGTDPETAMDAIGEGEGDDDPYPETDPTDGLDGIGVDGSPNYSMSPAGVPTPVGQAPTEYATSTRQPAYSASNPASPRSKAAYDALASGDYFRDPNGQLRIKP